MPENKICPLLSVGRATGPAPCLGDRCSWWKPVTEDITPAGDCALLTIAESLDGLDTEGIICYNS